MQITGLQRGCGYRVAGGTYLEVASGGRGHPLECFMFDPPWLLDVEAFGVSPKGQTVVAKEGMPTLVFDWVGKGKSPSGKGYWNAADILEEVRRYGASRRTTPQLAGQLTNGAWLVLLHPRGFFGGAGAYFQVEPKIPSDYLAAPGSSTGQFGLDVAMGTRRGQPWEAWHRLVCPQLIAEAHCGRPPTSNHHGAEVAFCTRMLYQDVEGGAYVQSTLTGREVARTMPAFTYNALARPFGSDAPTYRLAAIAKLPITGVDVVAGGKAKEIAKRLRDSTDLPVNEVDE